MDGTSGSVAPPGGGPRSSVERRANNDERIADAHGVAVGLHRKPEPATVEEVPRMEEVPVRLSALWAALMFVYLLGDELRLTSGDVTPGKLGGLSQQMLPAAWLGVAVLMLIPIVMVVVSVTLTGQKLRWISVSAAVFLFAFNVIGLPTYAGLYDKFLIVVGLAFNGATAWYAWTRVGRQPRYNRARRSSAPSDLNPVNSAPGLPDDSHPVVTG
jgi:hypothetical protein